MQMLKAQHLRSLAVRNQGIEVLETITQRHLREVALQEFRSRNEGTSVAAVQVEYLVPGDGTFGGEPKGERYVTSVNNGPQILARGNLPRNRPVIAGILHDLGVANFPQLLDGERPRAQPERTANSAPGRSTCHASFTRRETVLNP